MSLANQRIHIVTFQESRFDSTASPAKLSTNAKACAAVVPLGIQSLQRLIKPRLRTRTAECEGFWPLRQRSPQAPAGVTQRLGEGSTLTLNIQLDYLAVVRTSIPTWTLQDPQPKLQTRLHPARTTSCTDGFACRSCKYSLLGANLASDALLLLHQHGQCPRTTRTMNGWRAPAQVARRHSSIASARTNGFRLISILTLDI